MKASHGHYHLKFLAQATDFLPGGTLTSKRLIEANSLTFTVVNGPPHGIVAVQSPGTATDTSRFSNQPVVVVVDAGGNTVQSDCYLQHVPACPGLAPQCATESVYSAGVRVNISECLPRVSASLLGAPLARLLGTRSAESAAGRVAFTDLAIDSGAESPSSCMCPRKVNCLSCHCDRFDRCPAGECLVPAPFPDYIISLKLEGVPGAAPLEMSVRLEKRVTQMIITEQPELAVAKEPFFWDITLQAASCDAVIVTTATAAISVSINFNGGIIQPGILSGTTVVEMVSGIAEFTDLVLSEDGPNYELLLSMLGNVAAPDIITTTFDVSPGVSVLQLVTAPSGDTCIAGSPFDIQPQVILLDARGDPVELSRGLITAALAENPAMHLAWDPGKSLLLGTRVMQAQDGRATFTDLSLPKASLGQDLAHTGVTLTFLYNSIGTSTGYFYVKAGEWTGLFIVPSTQPVNAIAGSPFPIQVRVLLVDDFKNKLVPADVPAGTLVDVHVEEPFSRFGAGEGSSLVLQRHACQQVCQGSRPVVCTTCTDRRMDAKDGEVVATDLRIDVVSQAYRLTFTATTAATTAPFATTSDAFDVDNAEASYLAIQEQPSVFNQADLELSSQPRISIHDAYGNLMLKSAVTYLVEAQLTAQGGLPTAAGSPDVPGQAPDSICTVSEVPLGGARVINATDAIAAFTDLAVRPAISGFRLVFLAKTQRGVINATSNLFDVKPGVAVGLCNMSLPSRCAALSPCRDPAVIACVDAYGNVQPTCATCLGSQCDVRPYSPLPTGMRFSIPCHEQICVSILTPANGNLRVGAGGQSGIDCSLETCGVEIDQSAGMASFTQLVLNTPSSIFTFKFSTFVVNPSTRMIYEWIYISPPIENLPPSPILTRAAFSASFASISLSFDKETSMNRVPGVPLSVSDACSSVIDAHFLQTLGVSPVCSWSSASSYLIVPGPGASAGPTTRVRLSNHSSIVYVYSFEGQRLVSMRASTDAGIIVQGIMITPVFLTLPPHLPTPEPIVVSALKLSSCDLLSLDASLSRGAAMRPFTRYNSHKANTCSLLLPTAPYCALLLITAAHYSSLLPVQHRVVDCLCV